MLRFKRQLHSITPSCKSWLRGNRSSTLQLMSGFEIRKKLFMLLWRIISTLAVLLYRSANSSTISTKNSKLQTSPQHTLFSSKLQNGSPKFLRYSGLILRLRKADWAGKKKETHCFQKSKKQYDTVIPSEQKQFQNQE